MSVRREPDQKIKSTRPLEMCNKPTVALNYWWGSVRSGPYRDKNKLHFALQACVLLGAVYAVAPVPSIKVGMLGQQRGCRWSLLEHGGPETVKRPKSEMDAEQQGLNSQRCWRSCDRRRCGGCGSGWEKPAERLEGGQSPESPPSIYIPAFLLISLCKTEKRWKVYFYAVYSNAQRVNFPGATSLIISSIHRYSPTT